MPSRIPAGLEGSGSPYYQSDNEEVIHTFNFLNRLPSGETLSSATIKVYELSANEADVTATIAPGSVTTSSPSATVTLKSMTAGKTYRAECLGTFSGGAKHMIAVEIRCAF